MELHPIIAVCLMTVSLTTVSLTTNALDLSLSVRPIGVIRTQMRVKFDAPHQPEDGADEMNVIELFPEQRYIPALHDLEGFSRVWLIWWFHKNKRWRSKVLPPRGGAMRRGLFATRSPHRPNPIGITAVPLLKIEGRRLYVGNCDLIDGTPILDIKPYIAAVDSFPDAKNGWLDEVTAELALPPCYEVSTSPLADEQLAWLESNWCVNFMERAVDLLSRDPSVHRTRRITRYEEERYLIGCGAWRLVFSVAAKQVLIEKVRSGYPARLLEAPDPEGKVPDRDAQIAFRRRWPQTP